MRNLWEVGGLVTVPVPCLRSLERNNVDVVVCPCPDPQRTPRLQKPLPPPSQARVPPQALRPSQRAMPLWCQSPPNPVDPAALDFVENGPRPTKARHLKQARPQPLPMQTSPRPEQSRRARNLSRQLQRHQSTTTPCLSKRLLMVARAMRRLDIRACTRL